MLFRKVTVSGDALRVGTVVRRAEIGGCDGDGGSGDTPAAVEGGVLVATLELEAGAADLAAVEEGVAEGGGGQAVTAVKEVAVAARAAGSIGG